MTQSTTSRLNDAPQWDLSSPEFDPPSCPAWARVQTPDWVRPFLGKCGAPEPWRSDEKPMGSATAGIDRYQANHFVNYRPETAEYLYSEYTPLDVDYVAGTLPSYERLVDQYTRPGMSETEMVIALLLEEMPRELPHPCMPPMGQWVKPDRNLLDEELLASGTAWCNEQARAFVRLCQIVGMQGRIVHLFGQHHTVAEVYADGRWVFVDATNMFIVRDADGNLLSAAACHDRGAGQRAYAFAKKQRLMEMRDMPPESLGIKPGDEAKHHRHWDRFDPEQVAQRNDLDMGIINYPLPQPAAAMAG